MALFLVFFLLFPLSGRVSAGVSAEALAQLSSCGQGREDLDGLLRFFLARDIALVCDALKLRVPPRCAVDGESTRIDWRRIGEEYCSLAVPSAAATLALDPLTGSGGKSSGRKMLQQLQLQQNHTFGIKHVRGQWREGYEKHGDSPASPKEVAIAIPAAFLLCCAFLCPCFQRREREMTDETPLRDMSSGHLYRSYEHSRHSQGVPGSPQRMPGSPLRAPPSPFKVSGGLSRFAVEQSNGLGPLQIKMKQILRATQNFSESHVIGEGGFGKVYQARLPNDVVVAIKRARKEHFAALHSEFRNEIELLSTIEHKNLVRLLGYIDQENEKIIICEYVGNGNLRDHLDGRDGRATLDFSQRLSIAIDVAHALTYLHLYAENPIIHRDVKSSNILLTDNLRAKVADFGFARSVPMGENQTHISTAVKGTAGYVDPEYLRTNQLTEKSDVFSFGVLLLEIISGRRPVEAKRPIEERITLRWAFMQERHGQMRRILDPNLVNEEVDEETLTKLIRLAIDCAAPTRNERPSMKDVAERLWDIRRGSGRSRNGVSLSA